MCGINLIVGSPPDRLESAINRMLLCSAHRGPDESVLYETGGVALGFNRLEIVGGASGKQPIRSDDSSIILIGNGEVFNYRELKNEDGESYINKTGSDVEVIIRLYEEHGVEAFGDLEGQFSFVLFDKRKKKILLARDRWGITPLFYSLQAEKFIVSSTIRALIDSELIEGISLDQIGIAESWSLYGPTPPRTCFKNVFQLPPGCFGQYDLVTKTLSVRYYVPRVFDRLALGSKLIKEVLSKSVDRRLQGSYGPGIYVSGGVDSSIIAALANRLSPTKPTLFGIAFEDKLFDESQYQKELANYLNCKLQNVRVSTEDIVDNLEKCIAYTESPLIRTAPIPMMLLSDKVHSMGIKYVLCGEGADELFAGYPVFIKGKSSVGEKWAELSAFNNCFLNATIADTISSAFHDLSEAEDGSLESLRRLEVATKLSRYLLVNQGDRVAMANGVEQRFPFLDNDLAELAFGLGRQQLIQHNEGKVALRQAFRGVLPDSLLMRKKQGYLTPDLHVVISLYKKGILEKVLSESICQEVGIFDYARLNSLTKMIDTELKARFLLFAYSTHLLFGQFIKRGLS